MYIIIIHWLGTFGGGKLYMVKQMVNEKLSKRKQFNYSILPLGLSYVNCKIWAKNAQLIGL